MPVGALTGVREFNFSNSPAIKGASDTSFRGLFTALAGEGSDLKATFDVKRQCAAGCFQDKTHVVSSPEVPILKADEAKMITNLLGNAGTQSSFNTIYPGALNLAFLPAQEKLVPVDNVLSARGNIFSATGGDGSQLSQLQELMPAHGLDPDAIEVLQETGGGAAKDAKAVTFINRLMSALKESGLTSPEIHEVEQMLTSLNIERQGLSSSEARLVKAAQELLVRMGINTQVVDQTVEPGKIPPDAAQNILEGLAVKPARPDAVAQKVSLSDARQPAELLNTGINALQAIAPGKISPGTGNEPLEKLAIKPEAADAMARPVSLSETGQTAGLLKTNINPGQAALLSASGDDSGSTAQLNDVLKGSLHHAAEKGAVILIGSDDAGEDVSGRDSAGTGDGRLGGTGAPAPGTGSGKVSSAERIDFDQQLSRAQGREVTAQKVMEQLVSGARMQVESGRTRAKIFLQPPALGKVNLHIVTKDDQVRVAFFAETPQVKEIIESNLSQLRQSFMEQGLRADHLEVFVGYQQTGSQAWQSHSFDAPGVPGSAPDGQRAEDDPALRHERQRISGNNIVDVFI